MNIDSKILDPFEINNIDVKIKKNKKVYELIMNDIDNLILLCKNHLHKYDFNKRNSISKINEQQLYFNKSNIGDSEENKENNSKKVKFFLENDETDKIDLVALHDKFNNFKNEMTSIKNILNKKLEK